MGRKNMMRYNIFTKQSTSDMLPSVNSEIACLDLAATQVCAVCACYLNNKL